jgi:hypothetical protein
MVECIFAEVGPTVAADVLARVNFDGTFRFAAHGIAVAHTDAAGEVAAAEWLGSQERADLSLAQAARLVLAAWRALTADGQPFVAPDPAAALAAPWTVEGRTLEVALLARGGADRVRYRALAAADLA